MFCKYCGKEVRDNADYCAFCGKLIRTTSKVNFFGKEENNSPEKNVSNKHGILVLVLALVLLVMICIGMYCWNDSKHMNDNNKNTLSSGTSSENKDIDSIPKKGCWTLVSDKYFDAAGKLVSYIEYENNSKGHHTKKRWTRDIGTEEECRYYYLYENDEEGIMKYSIGDIQPGVTKILIECSENGEIYNKTEYSSIYDDDGKCITSTSTITDDLGKELRIREIKNDYYDKKSISTETVKDENGVKTRVSVQEKDDSNKTVKYIQYYGDTETSKVWYTEKYFYDDMGKKIRMIREYPEDGFESSEQKYEYDRNGNIIKVRYFNGKGIAEGWEEYIYEYYPDGMVERNSL